MRKTVLVTGASRGIGKAIACEFAKAGYNLVITCKTNKDLLNETYEEVTKYMVKCDCYMGDLSKEHVTLDLFSYLDKRNITIDILINNAGISYFGLLQDMKLEQWNEVINSNLTSVFLLSKSVIPSMVRMRYGKIINISSVWGLVGSSNEVAYSTSKGALNSFTKALAKELAPSNIQVNAIACGIIDTDMNKCLHEDDIKSLEDSIPIGRMGKTNEVANLALNLVQSSDYLTGQIIALDGGWI